MTLGLLSYFEVEHARERRDTQLLNEKSKIEEAEEKRAQKEEALLQKKVEHEKKPGCTVTIRDKSIEPPEEFDNELLETGEKWGQVRGGGNGILSYPRFQLVNYIGK